LRGAIFSRRNGDRLRRKLRQLGIGVAMRLRLEALGIFRDGGGQDKLPFELAAILCDVFLFQNWGENCRRGYWTIGAGRPSL